MIKLYGRSCFVSVKHCLLFVIFCASLGCAAAQIALEKKDLKVNLSLEEALSPLLEGLARLISGIFQECFSLRTTKSEARKPKLETRFDN